MRTILFSAWHIITSSDADSKRYLRVAPHNRPVEIENEASSSEPSYTLRKKVVRKVQKVADFWNKAHDSFVHRVDEPSLTLKFIKTDEDLQAEANDRALQEQRDEQKNAQQILKKRIIKRIVRVQQPKVGEVGEQPIAGLDGVASDGHAVKKEANIVKKIKKLKRVTKKKPRARNTDGVQNEILISSDEKQTLDDPSVVSGQISNGMSDARQRVEQQKSVSVSNVENVETSRAKEDAVSLKPRVVAEPELRLIDLDAEKPNDESGQKYAPSAEDLVAKSMTLQNSGMKWDLETERRALMALEEKEHALHEAIQNEEDDDENQNLGKVPAHANRHRHHHRREKVTTEENEQNNDENEHVNERANQGDLTVSSEQKSEEGTISSEQKSEEAPKTGMKRRIKRVVAMRKKVESNSTKDKRHFVKFVDKSSLERKAALRLLRRPSRDIVGGVMHNITAVLPFFAEEFGQQQLMTRLTHLRRELWKSLAVKDVDTVVIPFAEGQVPKAFELRVKLVAMPAEENLAIDAVTALLRRYSITPHLVSAHGTPMNVMIPHSDVDQSIKNLTEPRTFIQPQQLPPAPGLPVQQQIPLISALYSQQMPPAPPQPMYDANATSAEPLQQPQLLVQPPISLRQVNASATSNTTAYVPHL